MTTPLKTVREAWEGYRASLSREVKDREALRRAMRKALGDGVSQSEIARVLGVPRQHVHRLLRGR